ncbi:hypothetical protein [Nocardioides sp. LS1]|uniref:hypothetical protein n=1 Tax=Nocardioides sp. LS1 TaxID=1027620 RepID=UPI000F624051|nr:hypothetical protein [Nocardioides sp. LS1]
MRMRVMVLALVAALLAMTPPAQAATPAPGRALWLWDRPDAATVVAFAVEHGVSEVFVSLPPDLAHDPSLGYYQDLRARTRAAGITMSALGSETTYVDQPKVALAWQRSALSTGLFDGVHLDIEPWAHPDWKTARAALLDRYLALLSTLAGDTTLPVEADIAFWLDTIKVHGHRLDKQVIARVDAVTVMTYRHVATGSDGILALGAKAIEAATAAGKPVRLAVETNHLGDGPIALKQTFWSRPEPELTAVLGQVDAGVPAGSTYRGIAVHDYEGWRALAEL